MQTHSTIHRLLIVLVFLVGYSASSGQPRSRFPGDMNLSLRASATALSCARIWETVIPYTNENGCAGPAATDCIDRQAGHHTQPTLGGGHAYTHAQAASNAVCTAKGNRAWIGVTSIGGVDAEVGAILDNFAPEGCSFALPHESAYGNHSADGTLGFELTQTAPAILQIVRGYAASRNASQGGECGGLFCDPPFHSFEEEAHYLVMILDANGNPVFVELSAESGHGVYEILLPPGRYSLLWISRNRFGCSVTSMTCPGTTGRCMVCSVMAIGGSSTTLGVTLVINRRLAPILWGAVRAEVDGSYSIDDGDLLSVIAEWGNNGYESLAAVNNDGVVDDGDLLLVLQWLGTEY